LSLKCPICGAKLLNKQVCPYCKVTDEEIRAASNKKVKEYRKTGNTDMIHFTNILPPDVKRWKITLYTFLLGWLGINHIYVNRPYRAAYSMVSTIGSLTMIIISMFANIVTDAGLIIFNLLYEILMYMMAINIVMWFSNMISCIFKGFKVPVVLPNNKEKK